jgi:hypothetical protein
MAGFWDRDNSEKKEIGNGSDFFKELLELFKYFNSIV